MEYQVRAARITDIDRIVAMRDGESMRRDPAPLAARDLPRQFVDLSLASVLVAAVGGAAGRAN